MIRVARPADVAAMAEIARASFSVPWSADAFRATLGPLALVDEIAGRVCGYAVARHTADEAEILDLAVHPSARRQGSGKRLVDAVVSLAARRGAHRLFLEVRESNAPARALYQSRGFAAAGRRPGYYTQPPEDGLILAREIGNFSGSA